MKIVVSSFYYPNYAEFAKKTIHGNHEEYCRRNGYTQVVYPIYYPISENGYTALCEAGRMNAIKVIRALQDNPDCDYVFTLGCDAVVTNLGRKLEGLALYYRHFDIVTGADKAGINTSQMLIKNTEQSKGYFADILKYIGEGGEHDQRYFWDNPRKFITRAPYRWMNAYDCEARLEPEDDPTNWRQGDFLVHLAGLTLGQREAVIDKWIGRAE